FPAYPEQLNTPIVAPVTTASAQRLAADDDAMSPSADDGTTSPSADDGAVDDASPSADDGAVDDASPSADDGASTPADASIDALLGDPALDRAIEAAQRALDAVPALVGHGEGVGSNSFVVAG